MSEEKTRKPRVTVISDSVIAHGRFYDMTVREQRLQLRRDDAKEHPLDPSFDEFLRGRIETPDGPVLLHLAPRFDAGVSLHPTAEGHTFVRDVFKRMRREALEKVAVLPKYWRRRWALRGKLPQRFNIETLF